MTDKPDYTVVSFSGGKDSTAMLLHMIELGDHIDEVITADTGMEFPDMYEHQAKVFKVLDDNGIKYTVLKNKEDFYFLMFEREIPSKKYGTHKGYGWPSAKSRWCSKHLKTELISKYFKELRERYNVIQCIDLASDEVQRLSRSHNQKADHRHPLVEWGWSEADCLQYCYEYGYNWGGLYEIFGRVSCWCCPIQPYDSLRALYANYPDLWNELKRMDKMILDSGNIHAFKVDVTVESLTHRFEVETRRKALGLNCSSRNFYREVKPKGHVKGQTFLDVGEGKE